MGKSDGWNLLYEPAIESLGVVRNSVRRMRSDSNHSKVARSGFSPFFRRSERQYFRSHGPDLVAGANMICERSGLLSLRQSSSFDSKLSISVWSSSDMIQVSSRCGPPQGVLSVAKKLWAGKGIS